MVASRVLCVDSGLTDVEGVEMLSRDVLSTMSEVGRSLLIRAMIAGSGDEETSMPVAAYYRNEHEVPQLHGDKPHRYFLPEGLFHLELLDLGVPPSRGILR